MDYNTTFHPVQYRTAFYSSPDGADDENGYAGFVAKKTQECFELMEGHCFLEIGCGPCIHVAIEASKKFDKLVMSDISTANTDEVEKWLDGEKNAVRHWQWLIKLCSEKENIPGKNYPPLQI